MNDNTKRCPTCNVPMLHEYTKNKGTVRVETCLNPGCGYIHFEPVKHRRKR